MTLVEVLIATSIGTLILATAASLRHIPGVFEAVRAEFGAALPLLHDAHHRLTANQAAQLGRSPGALPAVLARGLHPGGEPGGAAPGPFADHDAPRDR